MRKRKVITGEQAAGAPRRRRRRRGLVLAAVATGIEAVAIRARGYGFAGNVVVRCRSGHLFTTLWIPGASVKALRLGPWRVQRCPVGDHWSLVTPVRRGTLTEDDAREAASRHDRRIP